MEEEKAAALYDELTRKGSGAARFKQGLGFSSGASDPPPKASALPSSSSSFLSQFVKASNSTSDKATTIDREKQKSQIENIQNKLRKKEQSSIEPQSKDRDRRSDRGRDRDSERHSREIRSTERARRRRSRSRSCSSEERDRRHRRRRRSRSRSYSDEDRRRRRERRRRSPSYERSESGRGDRETRRRSEKKESNGGGIDCAKLIQGYDNMTPAERVKAKMKLQLFETAAKDTKIGTGSGWERFEFNTDAPLDNEDDEIEGAHDDTKVVKHLGQTFRFSNVQARREEEIKSAHDEAMFGAPAATHDEAIVGAPVRSTSVASEGTEESESENKQIESNDPPATGLFSDKLLAKKQGSWRDRAPRNMK